MNENSNYRIAEYSQNLQTFVRKVRLKIFLYDLSDPLLPLTISKWSSVFEAISEWSPECETISDWSQECEAILEWSPVCETISE